MAKKKRNGLFPVVSINSVHVKLFLYVGVAVITSLIADLSVHTDSAAGGFHGINEVRATIIVLNFLLQGLIAWRAFIDGSVYQYQEELDESYTKTIKEESEETKTITSHIHPKRKVPPVVEVKTSPKPDRY